MTGQLKVTNTKYKGSTRYGYAYMAGRRRASVLHLFQPGMAAYMIDGWLIFCLFPIFQLQCQ